MNTHQGQPTADEPPCAACNGPMRVLEGPLPHSFVIDGLGFVCIGCARILAPVRVATAEEMNRLTRVTAGEVQSE